MTIKYTVKLPNRENLESNAKIQIPKEESRLIKAIKLLFTLKIREFIELLKRQPTPQERHEMMAIAMVEVVTAPLDGQIPSPYEMKKRWGKLKEDIESQEGEQFPKSAITSMSNLTTKELKDLETIRYVVKEAMQD